MYKRCKELLEELESEGKIKVWWEFKFPHKEELKLRLKDLLEEEVDEKYYLSDKMIEGLKYHNEKHLEKGTGFIWKPKEVEDVANTLRANASLCPTDNTIKVVGELDIKGQDNVKRVYSEEGLSPTLTNMQGGNRQPKIIIHNIIQKVKVRLYPVDIEALKTTLRNAKLNVDLNNKEIANSLQIPQTQVEHYFRTDNSFAIPSPEIWLKLKELLKIETNYFDESIMTFEEKDNEYDISNRVYDAEGIAPTQTIQNDAKILIKNNTKQGYLEAEDGDSVNLAYPTSNTRRGRVGKEVSSTLTVNDSMGVVNDLRIRKLTPLECWRLQGFDDEDFYKAKERLNNTFYRGKDKSNSQLYKQAGNSITVNVLEKIFNNLFY